MCLGIPGKVLEITEGKAMPMGIVDFGGVKRETCLVYVTDEVSVGNYVIVHAGFAISILDEDEAKRTLELLREIGELEDAAGIEKAADGNFNAQSTDVS